MQYKTLPTCAALALFLSVCTLSALAQTASPESLLRKTLTERWPKLGTIDEISKTPMGNLFELRINNSDILYTDAEGNYLIEGSLIDAKTKRNLTEERVEKLTAIDFKALPLKDAFTVVRGDGKRKVALFEDPNCGYCKRFERDLQSVNNVTVYMFLYPILGPDSNDKSRNIWCAKDKSKAWQDWMLREKPPSEASCDTAALTRNIEFGKKHKINGTPMLLFADGSRVPGAVSAQQVEKFLTEPK